MDERGNLPSASAASRYAACLGSYDLERQVAEVEYSEEESEEQPKQRYKVKASGEEVEVELDELIKGYQQFQYA